jgi:hypothetical protein
MKGASMKKAKSASDELRAEYKRSDFGKLERGKYHKRVKASSNVVILDAEVAAVSPTQPRSTRRCTPSLTSHKKRQV